MFFKTPENIDFAGYVGYSTRNTYSSKDRACTHLSTRKYLIYKVLRKNSFAGFLRITW